MNSSRTIGSPRLFSIPGTSIGMLFALFAISGFTGLVYESLWSHYLGLFLGHAAFAQSFVLCVFMGGLAIGAWLASRMGARLPSVLSAYGWTEIAIGVIALVFHEVFVFSTQASLEHVFPALGTPGAVEAWRLGLALAMLLPQAVLLGMTFPFMSAAVIRRSPLRSGHHLAMLYFTNSGGAALGALLTAFVLLGAFGMPGTMRLAGVINLVLGVVVLALASRGADGAPSEPVRGSDRMFAARLILLAAFTTGLASFVYEVAWIRMLSLVLGASFQAFELMLSAFITGLALGGFWIRRRIDTIVDPWRFAGCAQLAMGLAALGTVVLYHSTYDWMQWLLNALQRTESTYLVFNVASHLIAFAIMLPATFLAGMTLPLFTHMAMRGGGGERAIGRVYASNTLGSIAGVIVTVHVLLPTVGLKLTLITGGLADMVLGAVLLRAMSGAQARTYAMAALAVAAGSTAFILVGATLDPARLSSGVFRYGDIDEPGVKIPFYRDGKTASVALRQSAGDVVSIISNGKPDASVRLNLSLPPVPDETTMTLTAALPLLAMPSARTYAVVGMGAGLTTETVLSHTGPEVVDTIEIEPAMVDAARGFSPRVRRPFVDPRSNIHFEDAKAFFSRQNRRYDVIISEPSNPWVNGVAGLFSREFYRDVKRYLSSGGVFVQWIQAYELNDRLLASVIAAIDEQFPDYEMYESTSGDFLILAVPEGRVPALSAVPAGQDEFQKQLTRVGLRGREDLDARRFGGRNILRHIYGGFGAPANSDFEPLLQLEATRARFLMTGAAAAHAVANSGLPVVEMLGGARSFVDVPLPDARGLLIASQNEALEIHRVLTTPGADPLSSSFVDARVPLARLRSPRALCRAADDDQLLESLDWAARRTLAFLGESKRRALWMDTQWIGCPVQQTGPAVRERLMYYRAIANRDARAMYEQGRALLADHRYASQSWSRYVLFAAVLGAHKLGRTEDALNLIREHAKGLLSAGGLTPDQVFLVTWKADP
jgi:spermidine synthase